MSQFLTADSDFVPIFQNVMLAEDVLQCVSITLIDDSLFEPTETFFVDLITSSPLVILGSAATVMILNDDGKLLVLH